MVSAAGQLRKPEHSGQNVHRRDIAGIEGSEGFIGQLVIEPHGLGLQLHRLGFLGDGRQVQRLRLGHTESN